MHIVAVGLNHRTAPVEVRERVCFAGERLTSVLCSLRAHAALQEGLALSTCNRTEIYAAGPSYHPAVDAATEVLAAGGGLTPAQLRPSLYVHRDDAAVRHLFRVACGLDSMVLGETQVLGQVKAAYQAACEERAVGKLLHAAFAHALAVGKRAHTETGISQHAVSVSYAAVELARKVFTTLAGRTVLVIGAGKVGGLTARHLRSAGAARVVVANRNADRAADLALALGGEAIPIEQVAECLERADLVISSTGAPGTVLDRRTVAAAMRQRRGRPLFIVDIAVPRDVDPAVGDVEGVFLYDIDDLQSVVQANLRERQDEARRVERLIDEELARFRAWRASLDVVPLIRSLRGKADLIRRAELRRLFQRLPELDLRQRQAIEGLAASIVNKLLNEPTLRLKEAASGQKGALYAQAVVELFNLAGVDGSGE